MGSLGCSLGCMLANISTASGWIEDKVTLGQGLGLGLSYTNYYISYQDIVMLCRVCKL